MKTENETTHVTPSDAQVNPPPPAQFGLGIFRSKACTFLRLRRLMMRTFGEGCYYIEGWRRKVLEKFGGGLRRKV